MPLPVNGARIKSLGTLSIPLRHAREQLSLSGVVEVAKLSMGRMALIGAAGLAIVSVGYNVWRDQPEKKESAASAPFTARLAMRVA